MGGKTKKGERELKLQEGESGVATIGNKPIYRALNIASINPDNFTPKVKNGDIIQRVIKNKIHIDQHSTMTITILVTYAPNSGYTKKEKQIHWTLVQETLSTVQKTHMTLCCADANGKLGNKTREGPKIQNVIGVNTVASLTEPENGNSLKKT